VVKTVWRGNLGRALRDERMVGVKQETKVASIEEGRIGAEKRKREGLGILESWIRVPISMNSVLDVLRERLEDIQSARLEKRAPRLLAVDLKASEGERYVDLSVFSIEVVIASARE
jgi:hypothetical protein